jgi:hypothetical protein
LFFPFFVSDFRARHHLIAARTERACESTEHGKRGAVEWFARSGKPDNAPARIFDKIHGSAKKVVSAVAQGFVMKPEAVLTAFCRAALLQYAEALLSCCFNPLSVEMLYYNFTEIHPT